MTDTKRGPSLPTVGAGVPTPQPEREHVNLCQLGPCAHYHELQTKLDAQDPLDGSDAAVFIQTSRTCYPSPGIEFDINEAPVKTCSLWDPGVPGAHDAMESRRAAWLGRNLDKWKKYYTSWRPAKDAKDDE